MPQPPPAGEGWLQPAGPAELGEPTPTLRRRQHSQVRDVDSQAFMAQGIRHHAGCGDEALITGSPDTPPYGFPKLPPSPCGL